MSGDPAQPMDDSDRYVTCKVCGNDMEWAECYMIDCEEGFYDLGEEDCINYDPGTYVKCRECDGNGGWWYCPVCPPSANTSGAADAT
jgi:hypothetical protein